MKSGKESNAVNFLLYGHASYAIKSVHKRLLKYIWHYNKKTDLYTWVSIKIKFNV